MFFESCQKGVRKATQPIDPSQATYENAHRCPMPITLCMFVRSEGSRCDMLVSPLDEVNSIRRIIRKGERFDVMCVVCAVNPQKIVR